VYPQSAVSLISEKCFVAVPSPDAEFTFYGKLACPMSSLSSPKSTIKNIKCLIPAK
jgi:hypothetical protein